MVMASAGAKRRVSSSNVASKQNKTARVVKGLVEQRTRQDIEQDTDWILAQLKARPEKVKQVRSYLEIPDDDDYDSNLFFDERKVRESIQNIPVTDLKKIIYTLGQVTMEEQRALLAKDGRALWKILMRTCVLPHSCPIGLRCKADFQRMLTERMAMFNQAITTVTWDRTFCIDWAASGVFHLLPPYVGASPPGEHVYQNIEAFGTQVTLKGPIPITAEWVLYTNWNLWDSKIGHPMHPELRIPCLKYFHASFLDAYAIELIPDFVSAGVFKKGHAIQDVTPDRESSASGTASTNAVLANSPASIDL
eukprot:4828856-Amphidinium_carterae.2